MVALFGGADNAVELECVAGLGTSGGDPAKIGLIGIGAGDAVSCLLGKGRRGGADEEASGKNRKAWRFSASQPRHGAKNPSPVPIARKSSTGLTLWLGRKGELFGLQPRFPVPSGPLHALGIGQGRAVAWLPPANQIPSRIRSLRGAAIIWTSTQPRPLAGLFVCVIFVSFALERD